MKASRVVLCVLLAFALLQGGRVVAQEPQPLPEQPSPSQAPPPSPPPPQLQQAPAAVFQEPEIVVPEGTILPIVLTAYLNSRSTLAGDRVYAEIEYPVWILQRVVIPRGSLIRGTVTQVDRPGKVKGRAKMAIRFDDVLLPNGVIRPLIVGFRGIHGPGAEKLDRTQETVEMDSSKGIDLGTVAGTTAEGAVIGAIADGGSGAAIGAGAGAAVGMILNLFMRGRELVLAPGTQFDLELRKPIRLAYAEIDFSSDQLDGGRRGQSRQRYDRTQEAPPYSPGVRRFPIPVWP